MSTAWPTTVEVTECTNTGQHEPHPWRGRQCAGLTAAGSLTISQVEVVANALGLDVYRTLLAVAEAIGIEVRK